MGKTACKAFRSAVIAINMFHDQDKSYMSYNKYIRSNKLCLSKLDETTSSYTVLSKEYNIIVRWGYNLFDLAGHVELNLIID